MKRLSIIIPVYNEVNTIAEVIKKVSAVELKDIEKEIIIVDDGSTDGTTEILRDYERGKDRPGSTTIFRYSKVNIGKGSAVRIGFEHASGDFVLIQDADLELDPVEYHKLVHPITAGFADVVYGTRNYWGTNMRLHGKLANLFLNCLTCILYRALISDMETAYKVIKRDIVKGIVLTCKGFEFEPEITAKLLRLGYKIHEVPVTYNPRSEYQGKKIGWTDGVEAIYNLLKYRFIKKEKFIKNA